MREAIQSILNDGKALYARDKAVFALLVLYSLIFAGFFFLPTDAHRDILYLSLPFSLYAAYQNRFFLKDFFNAHGAGILIVVAYLAYMALSLFWSNTEEEGREFDKIKIFFFLLAAMTGLFLLAKSTGLARPWLAWSFVLGAVWSGLYLLASHTHESLQSGVWTRLEGLGRAENSVMAGYLYALALLALFYAKSLATLAWKYKIPLAVIILSIMLLSQSRGPLLAFGVTVGGMMVFKKQFRYVALCAVLGCITLAAILMTDMRREIPILNRGDTGRTQVWEQAVENIAEKPLFGHGVGSKFQYAYATNPGATVQYASHPHSFYLGTLVQGGAVSLILLFGVLGIFFCKSLRLLRETGDGWPLAVFISFATLGLYDFGGVYVNLGVVWVAFWFQYALMMAREKPDPVV